jgi:hypothetical protein
MEVALVSTASVIAEESHANPIAAFSLLHRMQRLVDVADEMHDEL